MPRIAVQPITTRRLRLVSLSPAFLEGVLDGRRGDAEATGGFGLPAGWPEPQDERWLRLRLRQMSEDPASQPWYVRAMILRRRVGSMVGHIGFHGPPQDGAAEMGYTVFPHHRRQGYASEAARGLMDWARREHGVRRFIVSISPDNAPSLGMAAKLGFRQIGSHVDEEDGLELEFELLRH